MLNVCLKFESEAEANGVLESLGLLSDGVPVAGVNVDVIGTICEYTDEEAPVVILEGWHINLLTFKDDVNLGGLAPYIVTPQTPVRVWA